MRLLEDLPVEDGRVMCENRGTGITAMLEALRAAGMEPPHFDDRHTTFRLAFSNAGMLDDATLAWLNRLQVRSCILLLCNAASLSSHELEQRLGRNQTNLLNRHLSPLVAEGLLERVGTSLTDPNLRYRTTEQGRTWLEMQGEEL